MCRRQKTVFGNKDLSQLLQGPRAPLGCTEHFVHTLVGTCSSFWGKELLDGSLSRGWRRNTCTQVYLHTKPNRLVAVHSRSPQKLVFKQLLFVWTELAWTDRKNCYYLITSSLNITVYIAWFNALMVKHYYSHWWGLETFKHRPMLVAELGL